MVGVFTLPTSDRGERFQYCSGCSQGNAPNQYLWKNGVMSAVSAKLAQLITGFATTAARKRSVLPTIQAVSTPPPEPPVTNRLFVSTLPSAISLSTPDIRSS